MAIEIHFDAVDCAPIDSATVMVLRDGARGLEVLMVRRHGDSGVLGGVHVNAHLVDAIIGLSVV